MTRVVVAPDSLKGSLSARDAAAAIAAGVRRALPEAVVKLVPMADGGEGTVEALRSVWGGVLITADTIDPVGRPHAARYLRAPGGRAVIEVAAAGGLPLVADVPAALAADSRGTGILIRHALEHGAGEIVVCLGGSASTDGGAGLLSSLGAQFLDRHGQPLPPGGGALPSLHRVDLSGVIEAARTARWSVLCDVTNPMVGPTGAAAVFGPQKGATPDDVEVLDRGLVRLADALVVEGCDRVHELPGAGAAGGIGGALAAVFSSAELLHGADVVADTVGLDEALGAADLVLTAEGRIDAGSAGGKAVGTVVRRAADLGVPSVVLAGTIADAADLVALGLAYAVPFAAGVPTGEAMARSAELLEAAAHRLIRDRLDG